ncbi:MAG: hypothetical protein WC829_23595, partial [Hyphomicrobium sp.]
MNKEIQDQRRRNQPKKHLGIKSKRATPTPRSRSPESPVTLPESAVTFTGIQNDIRFARRPPLAPRFPPSGLVRRPPFAGVRGIIG